MAKFRITYKGEQAPEEVEVNSREGDEWTEFAAQIGPLLRTAPKDVTRIERVPD